MKLFVIAYLISGFPLAVADSLWKHYPQQRKEGKTFYGIVTGGTRNFFPSDSITKPKADAKDIIYSTCIAQLYAVRHGYAFYLEKQMEYVNNRTYGSCTSLEMSAWNKIPLLQSLIEDVDVIVWLDLDTIITENSFVSPLDNFLPQKITQQSECFPQSPRVNEVEALSLGVHQHVVGAGVKDNSLKDLPGASSTPFVWATQDINPEYTLNMNTAVLAVKRGPMAKDFLEQVWAIGKDSAYYIRHDAYWRNKTECRGYWGWPWEQGAIWDVLTDPKNVEMLRSSCIRQRSGRYALNTIEESSNLQPIPFVRKYSNRSNNFASPPEETVFVYHHSLTPAKYILKRMLLRGMVTSQEVWNVCRLRYRVHSV